MADVFGGVIEALGKIVTGDPELYGILYRTLFFSGTAVILAALWGTAIAMLIALNEFRGKTFIKTFFNSMMGLPTVALGLILFLLFSKGGPLGFLGLLYTHAAIIIGQAILVTPLLISIAIQAIEAVDPEIMNLAKTLGASESQASIAVLKEAVSGFLLSNIAAFNRAIGELGVVSLVGGSIVGGFYRTDVITTSISFNTNIGNLGLAVALGIFLMIIVFIVNILMLAVRNAPAIMGFINLPLILKIKLAIRKTKR
ncbi:MAG TPA: ABC transporter permease [Candidatus Bathyarchaeia archaeon]